MPLLTHDQIMAAEDIQFAVVNVPEWGGDVRVRGATAAEQDEYDESLYKVEADASGKNRVVNTSQNAKARLIVKCMVDEDGDRMYEPGEEDKKAKELGSKAHTPVDRVFKKVQELSGRTVASKAAIEKKLDGEGTTSSNSSLPDTSKSEPSPK